MSIEQDAVVVVLGATGNLGRACIERFRDDGARIVAVDRSNERLKDAYGGLDADRHMLVGDVDLTGDEAVADLFTAVVERLGRVDAVVNTVGAFRGGEPVYSEKADTWDFLMHVNVRPAVMVARSVVPVMLQQGSGRIINVASRNAFKGAANFAAYSAAKASLLRLTESLADEVKDGGVNVNCVVPGTIDTPQNRESMPDADPIKWVTPEAVADVISFLASPESRAINGAAIPAYGQS
jgi:NAD(P)-dependent dehydrogenase (short-subunit alcohol dehydrogenase family)